MSKQVSDSDRRPHIENSSLWVRKGEEDPMSQRFRIASTDFLDEIEGRTLCDRCLRSRKYFCYTCIVPLPEVRDRLPVVSLPVKVDIIKHSQEVDGKSTAIHAPIIAPDDCTIHTFPDIPDWTGLRVTDLHFWTSLIISSSTGCSGISRSRSQNHRTTHCKPSQAVRPQHKRPSLW